MGFSILSFQQNKHRGIILFQLLAGATFVLHFCCLGAYTGAALNTVDVLRSIIFINRGKKWADNVLWVVLFVGLCAVSCIFTWIGPLSLLPMTGMMLTTVSMWLKDPKWVRRISLPASPLWITYNALTKSYAGVCTELFVITSIIVGMLRHDRKRGKKEKAIEC